MKIFKIHLMRIIHYFRLNRQLSWENIALRSQLAIVQCKIEKGEMPKPRVDDFFRKLWGVLSKRLDDWKDTLMLVKPETVLGWHKRTYKWHWRRKSRPGRPRASKETIALIKQIHNENPLLSPEKIYERLENMNVFDTPAPKTIKKYLKPRYKRKPPTDKQRHSWQTFLRNHAKGIWAIDFAVVHTLFFKPLYVLFIISHERRMIEHVAVTEHPSLEWTKQHIRNATPYGKQPRYLIHDNDSVFTSKSFQKFLLNCNIFSKRTGFKSPWQNGICERLIGTVRRELFDHIVPFNQKHLEMLLGEYAEYYNNVRTHQFLDGETPVVSDLPFGTLVKDTALRSKPILGGLYHDYEKRHSRNNAA